MLDLIIPSLALRFSVETACTNWKGWIPCQREAQQLMEEHVVTYADRDYIMAHDYLFFEPIKKLKKNSLIIYKRKRYRVENILFIDLHDTWVLNYPYLSLQTCDGDKTRIVQARPV